jgi:hypothetical protein
VWGNQVCGESVIYHIGTQILPFLHYFLYSVGGRNVAVRYVLLSVLMGELNAADGWLCVVDYNPEASLARESVHIIAIPLLVRCRVCLWFRLCSFTLGTEVPEFIGGRAKFDLLMDAAT